MMDPKDNSESEKDESEKYTDLESADVEYHTKPSKGAPSHRALPTSLDDSPNRIKDKLLKTSKIISTRLHHIEREMVEAAEDHASGAGSFLCLPFFARTTTTFDDKESVTSATGTHSLQMLDSCLPSSERGWNNLSDISSHTDTPLVHNGNNKHKQQHHNHQENEHKLTDHTKSYVEHMMSIPEIASAFGTSININNITKSEGLSKTQVDYLLNQYGLNILTPPVRTPLWLVFLMQFTNMFMVLLLVAAILSIITFIIHPPPRDPMNLYLGIFLIVVVIMTCYSTYRQEAKSDELMAQFKAMLPSSCTVIREGVTKSIRSEALVVGDLVWIKAGDKVPADCRVLSNTGLRVDQSMITGESEPVESTETAVDPTPLESRNLIFNGSLIVDGGALVVVVRTGDNTLLGSMVKLTGDMGKRDSTLKADVDAFVWVITKIAVTMATFIFVIGVSRGLPVFQTLLDGFVVTIIANMPCGLPSTVTACLFIVAERMGTQKVFVKKLDVIETLGSCSLICTDKTGTLTENRMTVSHIWCMGCSMKKEQFRKNCVQSSKPTAKPSNNANTTSEKLVQSESKPTSSGGKMSTVNLDTDSVHTAQSSLGHNNDRDQSLSVSSSSTSTEKRRRPRMSTLLEIGILNSRVTLEAKNSSKNITPSGDATELGLYRYLGPLIMECSAEDVETFRSQRPKVFEIPFSSSLKWQLSIHQMPGSPDFPSLPFIAPDYPVLPKSPLSHKHTSSSVEAPPSSAVAAIPARIPESQTEESKTRGLFPESESGPVGFPQQSEPKSSDIQSEDPFSTASTPIDMLLAPDNRLMSTSTSITAIVEEKVDIFQDNTVLPSNQNDNYESFDPFNTNNNNIVDNNRFETTLSFLETDGGGDPQINHREGVKQVSQLNDNRNSNSSNTYNKNSSNSDDNHINSTTATPFLDLINDPMNNTSEILPDHPPVSSLPEVASEVDDIFVSRADTTGASSTNRSHDESNRNSSHDIDSNKSGTSNYLPYSDPEKARNENITDPLHPSLQNQPFHNVMLLKGAPDVILPKCSYYLDEDGVFQPVNHTFIQSVNDAYTVYGTQGERAIGFAMRVMSRTLQEEEQLAPGFTQRLKTLLTSKDSALTTNDFVFVGLISLIDPPRPEVPDAVSACHTAGVKVVMVTGDHPITACSIARKIGLITRPTRDVLAQQRHLPKEQIPEADVRAVVVHGSEIPGMTKQDWKTLIEKDEIVFARTSPEHKLEIVRQFTAAGYIVAMTGDGVNDAPALRQAAIGVAMGLNGSDVAREAADIILLDDNFASIVVAIKEGRLLFDNLKKSVAYTVSHLLPEVSPVLLFFVMGCPLGMPAVMALCIDLLTELLPATSLAFEDPESDIMLRPPRDLSRDKLVAWPLLVYAYLIAGLCETLACFMVYFEVFESYGISASQLLASDNLYFREDSPSLVAALDDRVYDATQQLFILHTVQSAFFLTVVCSQACHLFQVRARTTSVFSHGLLGNRKAIVGVLCALGLGLFVVYAPFTQHSVFHSESAPSIAVFRGTLLSCSLIWGYNEARKMIAHEFPNHPVNKYLIW